MGKSGMSRRAYTDADPTFAEALGRMRKEERTMAEKREEEGALSREAILSLRLVKEALDTDLPRKAGRALRQARQAKTAEELDALEDALNGPGDHPAEQSRRMLLRATQSGSGESRPHAPSGGREE